MDFIFMIDKNRKKKKSSQNIFNTIVKREPGNS